MTSYRALHIKRLVSGGMITNYSCTSSCGHCLYNCSPRREKDYIDRGTLTRNLDKIRSLGCQSIHVGGGEPFLDLSGLQMVVETTLAMGVHIEYVETNASWYRDAPSARDILSSLKGRGLTTLLISISPFHNEFIPFNRVKGVIEACKDVRMQIFPWIGDFYGEIDRFEGARPHPLSEYEATYGQGYLRGLPSRYWIHFGGRALATFARVFGLKPCGDILSGNSGGCNELMGVTHFHFDLFGNYVPGLCAGLSIHRDDLGARFSPREYPLLDVLYNEGIQGLFDLVSAQYGFIPAQGYMSKCHLCHDLRKYLLFSGKHTFKELQPRGFYAG